MISDVEFVVIREFDRTIERNTNQAQLIINRKNSELVILARRVADLEAELELERGRRRRAEFLLNRH